MVERDRKTNREKKTETERGRDRQTERKRQTVRGRERQKDKQREKETERCRDREREREKKTDRQRENEWYLTLILGSEKSPGQYFTSKPSLVICSEYGKRRETDREKTTETERGISPSFLVQRIVQGRISPLRQQGAVTK